jgi:hypothetical protein
MAGTLRFFRPPGQGRESFSAFSSATSGDQSRQCFGVLLASELSL